MSRKRTPPENRAMQDLIDNPGLSAEKRASAWLQKKEQGFTILKESHTGRWDKIASKRGAKWAIEVKGGLGGNRPDPAIIRKLIDIAQMKEIDEVGLLFMPKKKPPLLFRLEGGAAEWRRRRSEPAITAWRTRRGQ